MDQGEYNGMSPSQAARDQFKAALVAKWNAKVSDRLPGDALGQIDFAEGSASFLEGNHSVETITGANLMAPLLVLSSTGFRQNSETKAPRVGGRVSLQLEVWYSWLAQTPSQNLESATDAAEHAFLATLLETTWVAPIGLARDSFSWQRLKLQAKDQNWLHRAIFQWDFTVHC